MRPMLVLELCDDGKWSWRITDDGGTVGRGGYKSQATARAAGRAAAGRREHDKEMIELWRRHGR